MRDWFALLPRPVRVWLVAQFILVALRCPGHRQHEATIYCAGCGLRMESIQRAQELGALP